jgi:hypothetical protein
MEAFFEDYLERLQELNADFIKTFDDLSDQALDWVPGAEMNSLCVLVVHTTAATRFWIGDIGLGESSNRVRDEEFKARGLSKAELKTRFASRSIHVALVALPQPGSGYCRLGAAARAGAYRAASWSRADHAAVVGKALTLKR